MTRLRERFAFVAEFGAIWWWLLTTELPCLCALDPLPPCGWWRDLWEAEPCSCGPACPWLDEDACPVAVVDG